MSSYTENFVLEEFPNCSKTKSMSKIPRIFNDFKSNNSKFFNIITKLIQEMLQQFKKYEVKFWKYRTRPIIILESFELFYLKLLKMNESAFAR